MTRSKALNAHFSQKATGVAKDDAALKKDLNNLGLSRRQLIQPDMAHPEPSIRVRVISSTCGAASELHYASTYIVNNCIAIDAGCLGMSGTPQQQAVIRHVFLTHCHMDHIAALPVFLENTLDGNREPVAVYGAPEVLDSLQQHIFNGVIWPDFVHLSVGGRPLVRLVPLLEEAPVQIGVLRIIPIAVRHVVPAYGYVVTDGASTVVFGGDSGPTDRIWWVARNEPRPLAVILEASFPNELHALASITGHLTPALVAEEVQKTPEGTRIVVTHIKAAHRDKVVQELMALKIPGLEICEAGHEYEFGDLN